MTCQDFTIPLSNHTNMKNGPNNTQGLFNIIIYIIRNYHSNATVAGGFDEKNGISSGLIIGNTFSRDTHP